ncbi:MAG: universal stress protein [Phaeodactylibacter sp.]|nr:universal stress protein [Phaeodactylibacter sp.]MCB9301986.1 universal stress protein [Lewinellaceae bacterium]HQU60480.1 universal stress protein [Saprospiraceae bacterium]
MQQAFSRTLLAMDLSPMDQRLLKYVAANAGALGIEKAYFVHIMENFAMPKNVDVQFQKLFAPEYPIDEKVRDKMSYDIGEVLGRHPELDCTVEVLEGKPYEKLIHWTKVKEIDLLVVGKKKRSEGSGITARRVARNTACNVLFLPDRASLQTDNIVVPMDFSSHSRRALQVALAIQERLPGLKVHGLYIVDLPPADYYSRTHPGLGYRAVLMESAQLAYHSFMEDNGFPESLIEMNFLENKRYNITSYIESFAKEKTASLVVMGARGHSPLETFLFGSITEKLVERVSQTPVLVIR